MPQAWFAHFYDVGILSCLSTLGFAQGAISQAREAQGASCLMALALLLAHLARRCLETRLLMHYPSHARMHAIAYAFGLRCGLGREHPIVVVL